jgi:hypothetical protein
MILEKDRSRLSHCLCVGKVEHEKQKLHPDQKSCRAPRKKPIGGSGNSVHRRKASEETGEQEAGAGHVDSC